MIEQKAIYEAAQTAFEAHHPKFPFPKKNNLDEQSDKFKKAFLVFSADINAMHEREIESIAQNNNKLRERLGVAGDECRRLEVENRELRMRQNPESSFTLFAFICGLIVGGLIIHFII